MGGIEERLRGPWLAALAGDGDAYASCLTELAAMLRAYFRRRLTRWPDEVEDLVQETLIAVHNQRSTTTSPRSPRRTTRPPTRSAISPSCSPRCPTGIAARSSA